MLIFNVSKGFPREEAYSLTDQIRRSSRSVCTNIAEAYRKRRYPNHYISKLTDADGENAETQVWLDFALRCTYLPSEKHDPLISLSHEVGRLIGNMIHNPQQFGFKL